MELRRCVSRYVLIFCLFSAGLVTEPAVGAQAQSQKSAAVIQSSGGPDSYGYTWNDAIAYSWIDARDGGYSAGLGAPLGAVSQGGAINLGFSFPFYENAYTGIIPSTAGVIGFGSSSLGFASSAYAVIPTPNSPNNFIAPLFYGFGVNYAEFHGNIYYKTGGSAPNRYFVMEWYQVSDSVNTYTFEVVLYESGNFDFNYQSVNQSNGSLCGSTAGIEDASGYDGLAYKQYGCNSTTASTGHTVRFARPAQSARVLAWPRADGKFAYPGQTTAFTETLYNKGGLGSDTFELAAASNWQVRLYASDGQTLLTNTNGAGGVDSGPISQGLSQTVVIKVAAPASATVGMSNIVQVTARSALNSAHAQTIPLQLAVPAPFVQASQRSPDIVAGPIFYRPSDVVDAQSAMTNVTEMSPPVLATTPDGNIVQVFTNVDVSGDASGVFVSLYDQAGQIVRPVTRLTYPVTNTEHMRDEDVVIAVAPNGNVGIAFRRWGYRYSDSEWDTLIDLLILNRAGQQVAFITAANAGWGSSFDYYMPAIVATSDNRFVLTWSRLETVGGQNVSSSYYVVYATNGQQVQAPVQLNNSSTTNCMGANLAPLSGGNVLFLQTKCDGLYLARLNSAGTVLSALTRFAASSGGVYYPDALQLDNGNIVLAWGQRAINDTGAPENISYAVLNANLGTVKGTAALPIQSPTQGDLGVSVVRAGNRAVLTWSSCCMSMPHLYYALVNNVGTLLTPPMAFDGDSSSFIAADINGLASTFLPDDVTPPENPVLASPSHTAGAWSNSNVISVTWSSTDNDVDGYAAVWDHAAFTLPATATKTYEQDVTGIASSPLADGEWYFHLRAVDNAGNWATTAAHLGPFRIDHTAPTSQAASALYAAGAFSVTWSGMDGGAGIASYDVWVRDGPAGGWGTWQTGVTTTSALYTSVTAGHTYYFRSKAYDGAGNVELPADLPADGDTHTRVALYQVSGRVLNARGQGMFHANVTADPAALGMALTNERGEYGLFFDVGGTYTLTAQHNSNAVLPPIYGLPISSSIANLDFVLPPKQDSITDGTFEAGSLSAWGVDPGLSATLASNATHSGRYGLDLQVPDVSLASAAGGPCITQSVTVQSAWQRPTLSWMSRVAQGNPADALVMSMAAGSAVISQSISLASDGWVHGWLDLGPLRGQTATLCIGFATQNTPQEVSIDDVSVGESPLPIYKVYMPALQR